MAPQPDLNRVIDAITARDRPAALALLDADPALVTARLTRSDERLIEVCRVQVYAGDTALHAAAFAHDTDLSRALLERGADLRARNRRGAEPLHAATIGGPGAPGWDPARQRAVIEHLIGAGADVDAPAAGGVTPLHRAVRNRCSAAVAALLAAGADPKRPNGRGSTAFDLARWTTGRSGSGSPEARAEQEAIASLLTPRA